MREKKIRARDEKAISIRRRSCSSVIFKGKSYSSVKLISTRIAESSYTIAEAVHYPPQPEADEGFPRTCYCCCELIVETSYTPKDPGRRYFTCVNVDDGDCHIWKW
ncbi:hypothetical protein DY000_02028771 [Brassica cretica]|uniref:Zinc finger GRF-type domain-containing protein n=1 Tax=Brassica cretica TaxID=69181 RepID=A0ABQ7DBQ6_BRACR|nr:hypothetical protein DY000_02028771 [Brassica cretica]